GRLHTAKQAILSVVRSRRAGFTNISVDVMFSIPGQTIELWKKTLEEIIELQPDHVSGYCLSIENDTRYYEMMKHNGLSFPDQEETADMYNYINEMLENVGLKRYEISNFARPGWECKHNQVYWNFIPYLGVGASAHSYDCTIRRWNIADPVTYIRRSFSGDDTTSGYEKIDARKHTLETIMLSLRIIHGLDLQRLETLNPESKSAILEKISTLIDTGFLKKNDKGNIVLTTKGVLLADEIILEIVSDM
ncbi:MAG TPA: hypothetical protein VMZ04_05265, partial [Anaerolineae bacterium]|nr:hypothetical protein [Anaerolineae bacterium]